MLVSGWVMYGEMLCDVLFWYLEKDFGVLVFL